MTLKGLIFSVVDDLFCETNVVFDEASIKTGPLTSTLKFATLLFEKILVEVMLYEPLHSCPIISIAAL